jgi:phosphate transport system permease protein
MQVEPADRVSKTNEEERDFMATQTTARVFVGDVVASDDLNKRPRLREAIIQGLLFLSGAISILTTVGIIYILGNESLNFFARPLAGSSERVSVWAVLTETNWQPQLHQFGMVPLILATLMVSAIAMLVALPVGLATAVYLSEYASERVRNILKPILEILAGVPTVVYGYFALTFMTPLLRTIFGEGVVQIFNVASGGIVVGILIIPLVTSISEDALHAVPTSLREAAYGLGATKLETSLKIVLPAALSGITAAFVVAISRAIGETMVVAIAVGAGPRNFNFGDNSLFGFILNPFLSAETMTGHIVRISGGDLSYDSIDYNSIFAIGLVLFLMTLLLNVLSRRFTDRFREVYE